MLHGRKNEEGAPTHVTPRANVTVTFPDLPSTEKLKSLEHLRGMVDLEKVIGGNSGVNTRQASVRAQTKAHMQTHIRAHTSTSKVAQANTQFIQLFVYISSLRPPSFSCVKYLIFSSFNSFFHSFDSYILTHYYFLSTCTLICSIDIGCGCCGLWRNGTVWQRSHSMGNGGCWRVLNGGVH